MHTLGRHRRSSVHACSTGLVSETHRMYEVRFMLRSKRSSLLFSSLLLASMAAAGASAQKARMITRAVDESRIVTMSGNTRPEATAENDLGLVPDSTPALNLSIVL